MRTQVLACVATFLSIATANTVLYRYGDTGEYPDQGGKWVAIENTPRNYYRDSTPRIPADAQLNVGVHRAAPTGGPCSHSHQQPYITGTQSAFNRYYQNQYQNQYINPYQQNQNQYQNVPIVQPYPVFYYIAPPLTPAPAQQQSISKSGTENYVKNAPVVEKQQPSPVTTTPAPTSPAPIQPPVKPPSLIPSLPSFPVSSWQNYLCSVFPYLPSCQAQQAQPAQPVSTYQTYSPYPGYNNLAQYPVYYIVQPELKPQAPAPGVPGTVGIIRIIGPNQVKPEAPVPVETPVKTSPAVPPPTDSVDTVVTVAETKTEAEKLEDFKEEPTVEPTTSL